MVVCTRLHKIQFYFSRLCYQFEIPNVILNNVKLPSEPLPPTAIKSDPPTPVAQGQPTQVTAQLIQTPQGPRIVLQGIQSANLSKDQLQSIQQQLICQFLKAQAEAKLQGKVPPTKIAFQLPPMTPAGPTLTSPPLAALPQQPQQINEFHFACPMKTEDGSHT